MEGAFDDFNFDEEEEEEFGDDVDTALKTPHGKRHSADLPAHYLTSTPYGLRVPLEEGTLEHTEEQQQQHDDDGALFSSPTRVRYLAFDSFPENNSFK